jgi:hypothetical protein
MSVDHFPITKHPELIGGEELKIAGSFRREWGTFEYTGAFLADYSVLLSVLPNTQEQIQNLPGVDDRWCPQVNIRAISWRDAGIDAETRDIELPLYTELGLNKSGVTVGLFFPGDNPKALYDELHTSMGGGQPYNPMVSMLSETAARTAREGIEAWQNQTRERQLNWRRKAIGAAGVAGAGILATIGLLVKQPFSFDMAATTLEIADLGLVGLMRAAHDVNADTRHATSRAAANTYERTIRRDIRDIFTPSAATPLQEL